MGRRGAKALHLALIGVGAVLYVVFVLPRWWVLTGDIPSGLALAGRLAAGVPIALAALPVLAILRMALARKAKTPELALRLRAWSAVLHVVSGALILLTAIVEIWLRLAVGGPYLFAAYGAAASIAILAILALYLSFIAEKPPAPPKPPKPPKAPKPAKVKKAKKVRGKKRGDDADAASEEPDESPAETETEIVVETEAEVVVETVETETEVVVEAVETGTVETAVDTEPEPDITETPESEPTVTESAAEGEPTGGGLRNQRPAGKRRHRLRR